MDPRMSMTAGFLESGITVDVLGTIRAVDICESFARLNEAIRKRTPGAVVTISICYNGRTVSIENISLTLKDVMEKMNTLYHAELSGEPKVVFGESISKPNFTSNLNLKAPREKEIQEAELICESFTTLNGAIEKGTPGAVVTTNVAYAHRFVSIGGNKSLTLENVVKTMRFLSGIVLGLSLKWLLASPSLSLTLRYRKNVLLLS